MDLSIIIPAYNAEQWIGRCLDSVLLATKGYEKRAEVIVVDDGSLDKTLDICKQYESHFIIVHHYCNGGVSKARNTGLELASGRWITFLDSDDTMNSDAVTTMLNSLTLYSHNNILQFNHSRYYYQIDKLVTKYCNPKKRFNTYEELPEMWMMVWNKLYRKSFLEENKIRFSDVLESYGEDERFNLECLFYDPIIFCIDSVTITRHFNNKKSLAHSITKNSLISQTQALLELLYLPKFQGKKEFTARVRWLIGTHWNSNTYTQIFGGELDV